LFGIILQCIHLFRVNLSRVAMATTMSAKELGRLQRTMNELLQSGKMDEFRILLNENAELIDTTREKGIITMVLRFAILEHDDARIASVFDRLSMKRDYFALMVYNPEPEHCAHLFTRYIDAALLDSKDIRFMIENRLTFLFRYLDGKFLHDSRATCDGGGELVESEPCLSTSLSTSLSRYTLQECEYYIQKIVAQIEKYQIEKYPKNKSKQHLAVLKKLREITSLYDAIIDGGNVLYSYNGNPNPDDLNTMIQLVRRNGCNPLVVIHKSHADEQRNPSYAPRINAMLRDVPHIITPAGLNDDLFILLAYLIRIQKEERKQKNGSRISIVTRDTYTDHMDKFKRTEKDVSDDFGKYLASDLVSFVNDGGGNMRICICLQPAIPAISHCIQIVEPYAYIPIEKTRTFRKIQL
jgi:hypothetical protein